MLTTAFALDEQGRVLLIHRTGWAENGQIVEWTRSVFRGDRFRFVARHRLGDDVPLPVAAATR